MGSRVIPSTFVKNVAQNGIGRHVCQLQRITLSFCKSHTSSLGARDFIENHLVDFSKANPGIVVYLKPRRNRRPMLQADYLNGYSEQLSLKDCNKDMIAQWIGLMKGRSGVQIKRLRKDWHTDNPSIQGVWDPFTFKGTRMSVVDFKDRSLTSYVDLYQSATEKALEIHRALSDSGSASAVEQGSKGNASLENQTVDSKTVSSSEDSANK